MNSFESTPPSHQNKPENRLSGKKNAAVPNWMNEYSKSKRWLWLESEFDNSRPTHPVATQGRGIGIRLPRHAHPDPERYCTPDGKQFSRIQEFGPGCDCANALKQSVKMPGIDNGV